MPKIGIIKMINVIKKIKEDIEQLIKYRKDKADTYGEVFTEFYLVEEHISNIEPELFKDPNSTFLDPCAGFGSYSVIILEKLMNGLKEWESGEEKRYKHILENQLFMIELQKESCDIIEGLFNPDGKYKLNLYNQSFLDFKLDQIEKLIVEIIEEEINLKIIVE